MFDHEIWIAAFNKSLGVLIANESASPESVISKDGVPAANPRIVGIASQYADLALAESKKRFPEESGPGEGFKAEFADAFNQFSRYVKIDNDSFIVCGEDPNDKIHTTPSVLKVYSCDATGDYLKVMHNSHDDASWMSWKLQYRLPIYAQKAETEFNAAKAYFDALKNCANGGSNV